MKSQGHEVAMFLFLLRAWEVRGAEQRRGKARRWSPGDISWSRACAGVLSPPEGSHLEQGERAVAENPLGVTLPWRQRAMPKGRKGVCSAWCDAVRGRDPDTAGTSGQYGSCQIE